MAVIRFEVWTRPDTGTFTRRFPLTDVIDYKLQLGMFGNGKLTIPRDHPRIDDILFIDTANHANDVGTLIRPYVGSVHLHGGDFYASRMAIDYGDLGKRTAKITGGNLGFALARTRLRQFDWDVTPSADPDWSYGLGENIIGNPGFEESADFNPGLTGGTYDISINFDDENSAGWSSQAGSAVFIAPSVDPQVSTIPAPLSGTHSLVWTAGITTAGQLSAIKKKIRVAGGERYQFVVRFKDPSNTGDRYLFGVEGVATTHHTNGFIDNGIGWAELDNAAFDTGATDGTWQQFDLDVTFVAGDNYAGPNLYVAYADVGSASTTQIDDITLAGYNLGLYSWEPTSFAVVSLFDRDTSPPIAASEGSATANITTTASFHGIGYPMAVVAGKTYTFSIDVYHETGSAQDFTVRMVRTVGGGPVVTTTVSVPNAGSVWTTIEVTGVPDVDAVFIQVLKDASGTWWVDNAQPFAGLSAAPVGEILGDMIADSSSDHSGDNRTALDWIVENYSDTVDGDGVNWDNDINMRLKRGSTYRRIIEQMVKLGYEFDMKPDPSDDTIIELSAFNPDALGTDLTTGDGGAVIDGFVSVGPLIRREPAATYMMVEGDALQWADSRNTVLETPWGEIEGYSGSKDHLEGSLAAQAASQLAVVGLEEIRYTVQGASLTPGIDYQLGDKIRVTPGAFPTQKYRVVGITVSYKDPEPLFQVSAEATP